MNAPVELVHMRSSDEQLSELLLGANQIPRSVTDIRRAAIEREASVLDRLERFAEHLDGLRRLSLMAREALRRELEAE